MLKTSLTALAAALCASAAAAQCPVSTSDSANGVYVDFGGFMVRYDRRADGLVEELETYFEDGAGFRFVSYQGAFVFESGELDRGRLIAGSRERTEYVGGVPALPQLAPGSVWNGNTTRYLESGAPIVETVTVNVQPERAIAIGACTYLGWPIVVSTVGAGGVPFVDELTYLPTLGFALYHGGADQGQWIDRAEAVSISTTPPVMDETWDDGVQPVPQPVPVPTPQPVPQPVPQPQPAPLPTK